MTAKTNFRGSFTALVTPFTNGHVDEKAFRDLVEWQIGEGTNGLVPVGTMDCCVVTSFNASIKVCTVVEASGSSSSIKGDSKA